MSSDIKLKWNGDHKQWITDYQDLLDNKRIGEVTDKDNKPIAASEPWPIATTAASYITRVALYEDHDMAWTMLEASGIMATGAKTHNTRRQVKEEQITADVLAQYTRANTRNEKAIDKSVAAIEKWDLSVKEALSILRISIRDSADVKRVIAALDKASPDLLWNAMAALKALEKDDDEDKTDTIVQLFTAIFKSGDTATIHVDKIKELVAKTKLAHGDKISVDKLAGLCFKKNLLLFPEFAWSAAVIDVFVY